MNSYFNELFDYNFYCNKKLIDQFSLTGIQHSDKNIVLFSHILNAHHIWNCRILGIPEEHEVFKVHAIDDFEDLHHENQRSSFDIVTNTNQLDKRLTYTNSEGNQYTNTVQEILTHIINHSTYHRGQIAMESRANGIEPLALDYIQYKR